MPYHGKKKGPLRGYRRGSTKVLSEEEIARREAARAAGANNTSKGRNVGRTEQPVDPLPGLFSGAQAGYKSLPTAADAQAAAEYRANLEAQQAVPPVNVNHPNFSRQHPLHPANRDIAAPPPVEPTVAGMPEVPVGDLTNAAPPQVTTSAPTWTSPQGKTYNITAEGYLVDPATGGAAHMWDQNLYSASKGAEDANNEAEALRTEAQATIDAGGQVDPSIINRIQQAEAKKSGLLNNLATQQQGLSGLNDETTANRQEAYQKYHAELTGAGLTPKPFEEWVGGTYDEVPQLNQEVIEQPLSTVEQPSVTVPTDVNTSPHEQQPLETPAPVVPADTQSEYDAAAGIPEVNQWGTPEEEETEEITPGSSVRLSLSLIHI